MAKDNVSILMRLSSVSEVSFMMSPAKLGDDVKLTDIQVGFTSQINPDIENDKFSLLFGVRYEIVGETILESVYQFIFDVKNLKNYIIVNEDQSITVNHLMPHFLSVAVGTMRGILVVKTAGTNFTKYPLPMIDVNVLNFNLSTTK